jgi:hypothetical protein
MFLLLHPHIFIEMKWPKNLSVFFNDFEWKQTGNEISNINFPATYLLKRVNRARVIMIVLFLWQKFVFFVWPNLDFLPKGQTDFVFTYVLFCLLFCKSFCVCAEIFPWKPRSRRVIVKKLNKKIPRPGHFFTSKFSHSSLYSKRWVSIYWQRCALLRNFCVSIN